MIEKYIEKTPSGKYRVRMWVNGENKTSKSVTSRKEAREIKSLWMKRYKKA
jgi:hypothetical protein